MTATPLQSFILLRGRSISSTDEDGLTTTYDYALGSWDDVEQAFLPVVDGSHLRTITQRTYQSYPSDTSDLSIQDATPGTTLYSATLLGSTDDVLSWQGNAYDDKNRLRFTLSKLSKKTVFRDCFFVRTFRLLTKKCCAMLTTV